MYHTGGRTMFSLYIVVYRQRKRRDENGDNVENVRNKQLFSLRVKCRKTRQRQRYSTTTAKRL